MGAPLKIFVIYAREDEAFKTSLLTAFIPLRRTGKIDIFHDALIKPGDRWEEVILENLRTADIILPLVSNDFFASEFIHEVEFKKAVDRYAKGETVIMPIIIKPCGWKYDPIIKTLQLLPKDGKPVVTWTYHEDAWVEVLDAVHEVTEHVEEKMRVEKAQREAEVLHKKEEKVAVQRRKKEEQKAKLEQEQREAEALRKKEEKEARQKREEEVAQRRKVAESFFDFGNHATDNHEKIDYYSKAIELDIEYAEAYLRRGIAKSHLKMYEEAIKDFDEAHRINPNLDVFFVKGLVQLIQKLPK